MIHLFKPTTTKNELIENNGDFILDHITKSAKITEELNGNYTLDLTLIIDKSFDSKCYDLISESSIIKIDDENGYEYFRIASVIKNKNYIDVFARHITISDILTMWLEDVRPENKNGNDALNWIFNNATTKNNFTVRSDISTYNTAYYLNKNVYEALFTVDNSFLNRWGGEVKRTGFTIEINKTIGKNNGVSIRSRKNLIGFEASTNVNELTTRIYPKGFDGITINEKYIDSEYINSYPQVFSREVVFDDVRVNDESYNEGFETLEEAQAELKRRSKLLFTEDKNDIIKATYKVDFVQLEKTEEYKNFAVIETTNLGDIVNVYDETLNVDIDVRVISRVYDCIKKERTSTTLSNKNVITKPTSITSIIQQLEKVPSSESILNDAKKVASTLLKQGNKDSYVVVRENEVLIMDTKDVNTAKKVWRFNNNGLGFSNTGYFGTYGLAMTMDGSIVADFITTGVLNGALIKAKSIEAESLNVSLKEKIESSLGNKEVTTIVESAIKQSKEEIELSISNTYETKTNVSSQINSTLSSANSYADTKKTEAINEANSTLNSTITNYYTKTQTDSAINVAKDAINLGVSNFKSEMMSASFTNLLYNSDFVKMENDFPKGYTRTNSTYVYNGGWLCPEGGKTIHIYTIGTGATWQGFYSPNVRVNKDQTMTASVYVATEDKDALQGLVGVEIEWLDVNFQRINVSGYSCKLDQNHLWYRITTTGSAPEGTVYARIYCWNSFEGATWWGKPMLQIGSVCAAWNKGGDFESLDERLSSAEIKITDDAITSTVSQKFYTKQQTEDTITSKGYATSSQVQQTVDKLQLKFTQSGGYNLLRNGKASLDTKHWVSNGGGISRATDVVYGTCFKTSLPSGIKYNGGSSGSSSAIRLKNNTHYVYEATIYSRTALPGTSTSPLHFWCSTSPSTSGTGQCTVVDYRQSVSKINTWTKCYVHILTASSGEVWFTPFIYTGGSYTDDLWVTEISLSEGAVETPYSPHSSEIYDGITIIDKDGVTVKSSNGAYTNFNSVGMNSFNNSGQQTLGIRNGGITFHPYSNNQLGAYITQSALWNGSASANGLAISTANNGTYISLGTSSLNDANASLSMDQALTISASDNFQPEGINFWKNVHAHGYGIRQLDHLHLAGSGAIQFDYLNNSPSTIYEATNSGHSLYVMGGYQTHIGCMDGEGTPKGVIWMQNSTNTHSYTHWNFHNYTMYNMRTATSYANTLSRKANEVYGVNSNVEGIRYLYKNVELVNGKAVRSIPSAYVGCDYDIVSIVCKGKGIAWVEIENNDNFQINGECKAVNVEIIIYPKDEVMTMCSVNCTESPKLTLPNEVNGEVAPLITNKGCVPYDF